MKNLHQLTPLEERAPLVRGLSDRRLALALILSAAGLSLIVSIGVFLSGHRLQGIFIGLWVPSILALGHLLLGETRHD